MEHTTREDGGAMVVSFTGDVDLQSSPEARKALLAALSQGKGVVADLGGVGYIDSSGVASMVEALQTAKKSNQGFAIANVSEAALRVLELARLDKVFAIHATIEEGVAAVS